MKKTFKTLIIINEGLKERDLDNAVEKAQDYFAEFPEHKDHEFDFDYKEVDSIGALQHKMFKEVPQSDGRIMKAYGLLDVKERIRQYVERGKYHCVIFAYDLKKTEGYDLYHKQSDSYVASWCFWKGIYPETEYVELAVNAKSKSMLDDTIRHELMHAMGNRIERRIPYSTLNMRIDQMDSSLVNGVWKAYYKEGSPYAEDGNYAITRKNYSPYWEQVFAMESWVVRLAQDVEQFFTPAPEVQVSIPANVPEWIILHHTGGTDKNPLADTSHHTAVMVDAYHRSLGWRKIGYHWFIEKNGTLVAGRTESDTGAHTIGYNDKSIGICLAGNFDATEPTQAQKDTLKRLLEDVMKRYNVPSTKIVPHRKFSSKTCFGRNLPDNFGQIVLAGDKHNECLKEATLDELIAELKLRIEDIINSKK